MVRIVTQIKRLCPSASPISETVEISQFWGAILTFWGLPRHMTYFPGANPMSIERSDFGRLRAEDFMVALKTDGVRHLLLLTCKPGTADPIAIMVDRAKRMYEIEVWAHEDFFQKGSLYDGELVWENSSLVFVVFDVMYSQGVRCTALSYRERMQIIHNTILCIGKSHSDDSIERMLEEECKFLARGNAHNLTLVPKKCVPKGNILQLWSDRQTSTHRNDGIIFTLNGAPVSTGTCPAILKWKPAHSVDLRVELTAGRWRLFGNANHSSDLEDITDGLDGATVTLQEVGLLAVLESRQPCIVECLVEVSPGRIGLIPERERTDKACPNTLKTIRATVLNAVENIDIEELSELVGVTV